MASLGWRVGQVRREDVDFEVGLEATHQGNIAMVSEDVREPVQIPWLGHLKEHWRWCYSARKFGPQNQGISKS